MDVFLSWQVNMPGNRNRGEDCPDTPESARSVPAFPTITRVEPNDLLKLLRAQNLFHAAHAKREQSIEQFKKELGPY